MSDTYSIERDLEEAEAMAEGLNSYVRQDQIYGSTKGGLFGSNMPSLTVGALLMRLRRLNVLKDHLDAGQIRRLEAAADKNQQVAREWHVHYVEKMQREAKSRLDAMNTFFDECAANPRNCANLYRPEALRRTVVEEIRIGMAALNVPEDNDLNNKLLLIDSRLRGTLVPGHFLWSPQLESAYSAHDFWWLYQIPSEGA